MKKPTYSYLRVSGQAQAERDGPDRQRDVIARYASAHGMEIVHEEADLGVSGTTELADRDGLAALLSLVQTSEVKTVLIERSDRLARDTIVFELIVREFRKHGAAIIAADSGINIIDGDSSNPTAKFVRQILAAAAELEKDLMVLRTGAARARIRRERGRCDGVRPYGDLAGESEILERMRSMKRRGMTIIEIAEAFNSEGVPTPSSKRSKRPGKRWNRIVVGRILKRDKRKAVKHGL